MILQLIIMLQIYQTFGQNTTKSTFQKIPEPSLNETDNIDLNDLTDDLNFWKAPVFIQENYPYFLSGYDDEGRPIWGVEIGQFDLKRIVKEGGETVKIFDKYMKQAAWRILQSIKARNSTDNPITEAMYLVDFEGLELNQIANLPTAAYLLRLSLRFRNLITEHLGGTIIVNANFVAENLINLLRPIFGPAMAKVEVYGTNKSRWQPQVLKKFPKNQIPEFFGGTKDFKPVAVYGR